MTHPVQDSDIANTPNEAKAPGTAKDNDLSEEERNALVTGNQGLVHNIARKYRHSEADYDDLIQEGNLGLLHAARKFDPDRGWAFSTYAGYWVRAYMGRANRQKSNVIRIPEHVIFRTKSQRVRESTRESARQCRNVVYLDTVISDDGDGGSFHDVIPDMETPSPEEASDALYKLQKVLVALEALDERDLLIIRRTFFEGATYRDVAGEVGLSHERVRQLRELAFEEMRQTIARGITIEPREIEVMEKPTRKNQEIVPRKAAKDPTARRFVASGRLIAELADGRMFYLAEGFNGDMEWKPVPEVPA